MESQKKVLDELIKQMQIWIVLTSEADKKIVLKELERAPIGYRTEIFALSDVQEELNKLGK